LSVHYRKPLGFSMESIEAAGAAVQRLRAFYKRVEEYGSAFEGGSDEPRGRIAEIRSAFMDALADDLNTARALGVLFELVREANAAMDDQAMTPIEANMIREFLDEADRVLGVIVQADDGDPVSSDIEALIEQRQQARRDRNFAEADRIRDDLLSRGIVLEDTREGVRWRKA